MQLETITYVRVGRVEVPYHRRGRMATYRWTTGYSEGGKSQPWMTRRECMDDADSRGARAKFIDPPLGLA